MGLDRLANSISASAGDYNGDGWLDLFLSHWEAAVDTCHLWENQQGRHFDCVDEAAGIRPFGDSLFDPTFSANFVDVDGNGWSDLLVASDFGTSRVLWNRGEGRFTPWVSPVISDENGMGTAIGDYDNDGLLDWFVSSVWDADGVTEGNWGTSGNRLYRSLGDGTFADVTDAAGVREGDWGWAACFADLNLDGLLDLLHVNGWPQGSRQFRGTPARLFVGSESGQFTESGAELGFDERSGGRGLVCFDYDLDGDIDLFVMNNGAPSRLWRNDGGSSLGNHLVVTLVGNSPNPAGIGALVRVNAGGRTQVRQIRAGSNYVSQDPAEAHFGLAAADRVELLEVVWPDGGRSAVQDVPANTRVVVERPRRVEPETVSARGGGCAIARGSVGR